MADHPGKGVRVVLWIPDTSELIKGRLPARITPCQGGVQVRLDALSYAALMASVGHFLSLAAALDTFQSAGSGSGQPAQADGGEGDQG